jgi:hypothetical protein
MARGQKAAAAESAPEAPAVHVEKKSPVVTVACKIPNGLSLQLFRKVEVPEPVQGGGIRVVPRHDRIGDMVQIRGTAYPRGNPPPGMPPRPIMAGGYALTPNVPADFWDAWLEQNKEADYVKNKMIFAYGDRAKTIGVARDNRELRSGLEPVNMTNDPRQIKPRPGVDIITTAPELARGEKPAEELEDTAG